MRLDETVLVSTEVDEEMAGWLEGPEPLSFHNSCMAA